jgi:hypothetical protein
MLLSSLRPPLLTPLLHWGQGNTYANLDFVDVNYSLMLNGFLFFLLLALFEHMRDKKSVYFCRADRYAR